jgi:glycolate oxidase iron-sulfur subunit
VTPEKFLDTQKSLACIHCGLCLASCPTYLETGNENDSPRGRIYLMRALQDGRLPLENTAVRHIDLCLGCRACEAVCPSGVEYGALLEATRDHIEHHYERSAWQNFLRHFAIEKVFPYPERMELALRPASLLKKVAKFLPKFAREALSLIPNEIEQGALPPFSPAVGARRARVGMVRGCVMSVMFDPTNISTMKLLNRVGYDVVVPPQQGCCGALYAHGGNLREARESAKRNIDAFQSADMVVINAAGCGSTLKEYGHLLAEDEKWQARGEEFGHKVKDVTEVLGAFSWSEIGETRKVTYHDACHLAHAQRITKPPREIIRSVVGKNFVELPESDVCCGSAGSYNLTEPEMAERLQRRKIENILKSGAEVVLTTNPGCLLQIRAGLKKAGAEHIRALHLVDYLIDAQPNGL